jgi:hypothetical protein
LDPDSVQAQLRNQGGGRGTRVGSNQGQGAPVNGAAGGNTANAELTSTASQGQAGQGQRGGFNLPEVTDKQCAAVTATLQKHPEIQTKISDLRTRMMSGEIDRQAMQAEMQKIYTAAGLDAGVARACTFRQRGAGGAAGGSGASGAPGASSAQSGAQGASGRGAGGRRALVFVATDTTKNKKYSPHMVRLGASNFDYSEVLSGVKEGDLVAILNVAVLQAKGQADMNQIRSRAGPPGIQRQQPATGGAAGGGAGARPGGAGQRGGGG